MQDYETSMDDYKALIERYPCYFRYKDKMNIFDYISREKVLKEYDNSLNEKGAENGVIFKEFNSEED